MKEADTNSAGARHILSSAPGQKPPTLRIALFSHSYLEPENRKNVLALGAYATVRVILPRKGGVLVFSDYEFEPGDLGAKLCVPFPPLYFSDSQYVLRSLTVGLRHFRPDVINVDYNPWSTMFLQVLVARALFCRRARLVCTAKKNTYRQHKGWRRYVKQWLSRLCVPQVDHFIAASGAAAQLLRDRLSVPNHRISVIHHLGVDTSLFAPKPRHEADPTSPVVIGYCGRLDADKGIADLMSAVLLAQNHLTRPLALKLLGTGSLARDLMAEADRHDWLQVLPPIPNADVARFLQALDIFVMPSRVLEDHEEHDSHALLEALAVGLPAIGTRSGIIPEILCDETDYLVNPESPDELAAAIVELATDPVARAMAGARGRRHAEQEFALDVIARRKSQLFEDIAHA